MSNPGERTTGFDPLDTLRGLTQEQVMEVLSTLPPEQLDAFREHVESTRYDWRGRHARPEQIAPPGNWRTWLVLSGRGWGKTRTGSELVREWSQDPAARIAVVGRSAGDVRDTMVEGVAGILSVFPPGERPRYEPSVRRIVFRSGAIATTASSEQPDTLRGPSFTHSWADELASWSNAEETWANLQLTLRIGAHPRVFVSTTPRPIKLLKTIMENPSTVVTRGRTLDNAANLAPSALQEFYARYGGTRLGRAELDGELLLDVPGALWTVEVLERTRVQTAPELIRIVVGVDPAVGDPESGGDLTGIVAAGVDSKGSIYILADRSVRATPDAWARRVVALYDEVGADRVVAEGNQGHALVRSVLHTIRPSLPVTLVHASKGKVTRAEPVSALWEQGRGHIVGSLPELEEELASFAPGRMDQSHSPDRADAAVWAISELQSGSNGMGLWLYMQELAAQVKGDAP